MKHYLRRTYSHLIKGVRGLFILIPMLCVGMLISCGRSSNTPVGQADSGGIAPKVQWDYRNNPDIKVAAGFSLLGNAPMKGAATFQSPLPLGERAGVRGENVRGGFLHKAPLGVYKVRATILDTSNNPVSGFQTIKDVAPGDSGTITFTGVPAGTYNVKLEGLDVTGTDILYTGQTNGIGVTANQVSEPTVIARYTRSDNASPGSSNKSPANGAINIPANTKITVQVSDADAGVDATSIVLTVNNENVTSKCSIIGTSDNYTVIYTPSANLSGTVTVTLRASDLANPANSMTTETWSFTISSSGTTDTTAPTNPNISFSTTTSSSQLVTPTISASDDTGVTGYYLSESSTTPSVTSSGWTSVTSTTSYNANVNFTLSSGNGTKTVYVWFKDAVGNISASANASITLNVTDTTAPSSPSVSINSGSSSTTTAAVTISLSATDNTGVTGYYLSESPITPSLTSTNWVSVTSTTSYSASVSFTLSSGSGTKTIYVWFRDVAGNISSSTNSSISLTASGDTTAPSSPSVSINSGASSTTTTSVTLTLSATDNVGVTAYYASETSTTPSASASGWTSVTSTTSYSGSVSFTLSSGSGTKTVYVWFRDSAGNVSAAISDSITLTVSSWSMLKLPDTGQTTSYTTTFGEDHDYTINQPSYTDNGNGTITDNVTGLMWQKEDDNVTRTWADAGTYCDNLSLGGQTDWRLPSKKELTSIVNYGTYSPSINATYFPNTNASNYWSSTTYAYDSSNAWIVSFSNDPVYYTSKSYNNYVRCVRGEGQTTTKSFTDNGNGTITDSDTGLMWQKEDDNTTRTWESAITYCEGLSLGSYNDWRLPNVKEIESITDDTKYNSSIDSTYFPNTNASGYWSSTTFASGSSLAWDVVFYSGDVSYYDKSGSNYVRCVRGGTVTDIDGNVYNTVTIGTQVWMKENLKVTKYRNGDAIPTTTASSIPNDSSSKYQWAYNNDENNVSTYGRLYTWYAATDSRGLCPTGWHLPTDAEWTTLTDYLGGTSVAGGKMKEAGTAHWNSPNTGADNSSGFTALPGGSRNHDGTFNPISVYGYGWSATELDATYAWRRYLYYSNAGVNRDVEYKYYGFSVRCVKD